MHGLLLLALCISVPFFVHSTATLFFKTMHGDVTSDNPWFLKASLERAIRNKQTRRAKGEKGGEHGFGRCLSAEDATSRTKGRGAFRLAGS